MSRRPRASSSPAALTGRSSPGPPSSASDKPPLTFDASTSAFTPSQSVVHQPTPVRRPRPLPAAEGSEAPYPRRPHKSACRFYMQHGTCSYGTQCKFDHPPLVDREDVALNSDGYPLREGVRNCKFYMRKRECRFGTTCEFNHPEPFSRMPATPATDWSGSGAAAAAHLQSPAPGGFYSPFGHAAYFAPISPYRIPAGDSPYAMYGNTSPALPPPHDYSGMYHHPPR